MSPAFSSRYSAARPVRAINSLAVGADVALGTAHLLGAVGLCAAGHRPDQDREPARRLDKVQRVLAQVRARAAARARCTANALHHARDAPTRELENERLLAPDVCWNGTARADCDCNGSRHSACVCLLRTHCQSGTVWRLLGNQPRSTAWHSRHRHGTAMHCSHGFGSSCCSLCCMLCVRAGSRTRRSRRSRQCST